MMRRRAGLAAIVALAIGTYFGWPAAAQAQANVGGPYEPDEHTVLLLHFDGNLKNESQYSADAEFHGDPSNFFFLPNPIPNMGQCLRIDNDSITDSAYVTVADTEYLDLTGDWTIEGWINIFTFGEGPDDWRWVPRLIIKTGDEVFWRPNYFVEMWGSSRFFSCGYHTASQDAWPQANTPPNIMVPGQWYHLTFIRDTSRHLLLTLVHDANRELISFAVADYLAFGADDPTPITTNQPVHIGYAGGGGDSFLDGFVDEIRISNVVREFPVPPIISSVTQLANQESTVPEYVIGAKAFTLFGTGLQSVTLYYDVGAGWQTVPMTNVAADSFVATIPGQPTGTIVKYYVEAVDNDGRTFAYPKNAGWGAAEYFAFGVYTPFTQTLWLNFEEGSGTPLDHSSYAHTVTVAGSPSYSDDAAVGSKSMYFEGDSSYLEIDSPFLTSFEFCVDFWFKAEEIENYCRILNRPSQADQWWNNNYQIRFDDAQHLQAISDGSVDFTTDVTIETGKWYHVIYEVQKAPAGDTSAYYAAFKLEDKDGNELYFAYKGFDTPVMIAQAPLRIGKAAYGDYPPYFHGYIDDVKIYNYAAAGLLRSVFFPEVIGGPYEPDEHTMLLMHFDGNLKNESQYSADGEFHGDPSNFYFLPNTIPGLGQCLRIDNDSQTDSAYVTVADTQYLDLTGDWTIEGWINIFTFGEGPDDWRWVPRLVIKTGDEVFWRPNYFVEMWGSTRFFSCGYHTASQDAWPQANTPPNVMVPGKWFHLTFVRDTTRHILLTMVHDENRELVSFSVADYLTFGAQDPTPITTSQPVHIGYAGGGGDSFLDGFVDEIRISNVVRRFPVPPVISKITKLPNQTVDVTEYEVGAIAYTLFGTALSSVTLYYDVGAGWQTVPMTEVAPDSFAGAIPQQPAGTVVKYYVRAVDNTGMEFVFPRDAGWAAAEYYTFGIYSPMSQTLYLTFEEGSGVPTDHSPYGQTVEAVGAPTYSSDAAVGSYSMYFEGDSSYLRVESPFLAAEEFCVDFWFKAEEIENYCRILNKANQEDQWWDNNYQIRFDDSQHLQAISDGSVDFTTDITIETGKWYHVIYEVQKAPEGDTSLYYGAFKVMDANGQELFFAYRGFDNPVVLAQGPLRVGKAAFGDYPPYFHGYIDELKIYNYAAVGLLKGIVGVAEAGTGVPTHYELAHNYPNPFNPSTRIRFALPRREHVQIAIHDVLGRRIKTLVDATLPAGRHAATWDGTDEAGQPVASGVYFYRLHTDGFTKVRKMMLLR